MTIKVLQRDTCPATWFIGRQIYWRGEVLELVEINGDQYTWIDVDHYDAKRDPNNGFSIAIKSEERRKSEMVSRDHGGGCHGDHCVDDVDVYGEVI